MLFLGALHGIDGCRCINTHRRGQGTQYLVRWVRYDHDHDEWLSGKMLEDTEALDIWEVENGTEV